MQYADLNDGTHIANVTVKDGYHGGKAELEAHLIDGQLYLKNKNGCFWLAGKGNPNYATLSAIEVLRMQSNCIQVVPIEENT